MPAAIRTCRSSGTPAGNCETFRCRFHGWTYDLQGRFLSAPPPVAPKDAQSPDLRSGVAAVGHRPRASSSSASPAPPAPIDIGALPAYGGTLVTEIACNWKVCVEHLLAEHTPSTDFTWAWPLLAVRRAGTVTIIEQVVPHTFLRTRLFTHVFGGAADDNKPAAATIKHVCEALQADRAAGKPAAEGALVDAFHRQLAEAYAQDRRRPELSAARIAGSKIFASHEVPSWKRATLLHGERCGSRPTLR